MNRALRRGMNKKHGLHGSMNRRRGGGYSAQGTLFPVDTKSGGDWQNQTGLGQYAVTNPYSDCSWTGRPGELYNQVTNTSLALAQTPMAGGRRSRRRRLAKRGGGCGCGMPRMPPMMGGGCGCGAPSYTGLSMRNNQPYRGGKRRGTRKQRAGGTYGFAVDPSQSVGGAGPNVGAYNVPVPCDGRAGAPNPLNPPPGYPDPRAPADLYSLSPAGSTAGVVGASEGLLNKSFMRGGRRRRTLRKKQRAGGLYGSPNAYAQDCYRGPGSSLPVYNASSAGFTFSPSTDKGVFLPDGVSAFNEVWPVAARTGPAFVGGRRNRKNSRKNNRKSRKNTKKSKRSSRRH